MPYKKKYTKKRRTIRKAIGKALKATGGAVLTRYKQGGMARLADDVAVLKRMVNAEKKQCSTYQTSYVNLGIHANAAGTTSGHQILYPQAVNPSITPATTKGTSSAQRTGDSIKVVSAYLRFHFRPMDNYTGGGKVRIYIIEKPNDSLVVGTSPIQDILDQDLFFGAYTTLSKRNQTNYSKFKVIATKDIYFPSEKYQTQSDEFHKDLEIKLKFPNKHIRYMTNSDTAVTGNWGAILVSNFGNIANNTGVRFVWQSTMYYYDN